MKRILSFFLITFCSQIIYSQWVVGPTVANIGANPSISAVSSTVAWVVGNPNNPVIYRTTDRGSTWLSVNTNGIPNNVGLYCVWGVDANTVYVGDGTGNAKVFKTTNAGGSWSTVFSINGGTSFFNGIVFARNTPSYGIAQCDPPGGPGTSYVVKVTTNSGATWSTLTPPGIPNSLSSQHSPFVIDPGFWGFGTDQGGIIDITTDGGTTWTNSFTGRNGFVSGVIFTTDKQTGIAAVNQSGLSKTTNGGASWFNLSIPGIDGAFLSFVYWIPATNVVYASSTSGGIKRSTDWGASWSTMTTGGQNDIRHMDYVLSIGLTYGYAISGTGATLTNIDTMSMLPVQLNYFRYSLAENNVNLEWETEFEINNSGFDIERASSGETWEKIANVKGNGNKSTPTFYHFVDRNVQKGVYSYRLKQIDYNGDHEYFALNSDVSIEAPKTFFLFQNFPNPFNPVTFINFNLPFDSKVKLVVYDIKGSQVAMLINGELKSGFYSQSFDGFNIPSGIYFYKLSSISSQGSYIDTKRMVLVK